MPSAKRVLILAALLALALGACSDRGQGDNAGPASEGDGLAATTRALPTLYPTPTAWPTPAPTETRPPQPTEAPNTPIPFDQVAVELRYWIPALQLDRRVTGNLASHIEVLDATTGELEVRRNQPGILFQIQRTLPELDLAEAPAACELCVYLEYRLPLESEDGAGWLTDTQFLASVENFTAAVLGPHFPPNTLLGLRRSATPYYPAHTVALTADGLLWRWAATEPQLNGPEDAGPLAAQMLEEAAVLDAESVNDAYRAACPLGSGINHLRLPLNDGQRNVQVICPELALPGQLVSLYQTLVGWGEVTIAESSLPRSSPLVDLETVIFYQQRDGARLNLYHDSTVGLAVTDTLTVTTAITPSMMISTTAALLDSDALSSDVDPFAEVTAENILENNILFVRGPEQAVAITWTEEVPQAIVAIVQDLDALIERLRLAAEEEVGASSPQETITPEPTATP